MKNHGSFLCKLALFGSALIWGSSFVVVKNTVDTFTPHILLGFRFTIGCLLLCLIFHRRLRQIDKPLLVRGLFTGALLFSAYSVQTLGITATTPGKNAFLTAVYCVIVPFLFWITDKQRPDRYNFLAAFLCIGGIGLVSLSGDLTIGIGDALTLCGGFLYAAHMVAVARFSQGRDPVLFTIIQFGAAAVLSWAIGLSTERLPTQWSSDSVVGLLYLAVFATAVALLLQNIGQKGTSPASASIILSLESVFGVVFSVALYGEQVTPRLIAGFVLIFLAILISETKLSFLRKKPAPQGEPAAEQA